MYIVNAYIKSICEEKLHCDQSIEILKYYYLRHISL